MCDIKVGLFKITRSLRSILFTLSILWSSNSNFIASAFSKMFLSWIVSVLGACCYDSPKFLRILELLVDLWSPKFHWIFDQLIFLQNLYIWLRESYTLVIPLDMFMRIPNIWLTFPNKLLKIYGSMFWYGLDMIIDEVNGQIWLLLFGLHVETHVSGFILGKWARSGIIFFWEV